MEDNLKELKCEYKKKKKESNSFSETRKIRHDYKVMKKMLKNANKFIKKNNLLESTDEFWNKFDFQSFDDFKNNNENISIKGKSNEKIDETIKQIDKKI